MDKGLTLGIVGGLSLCMAVTPEGYQFLRNVYEGAVGISPQTSQAVVGASEIRAEAASPTLQKPLQTEQLEELFRGTVYFIHGRYSDATPILGKYALLGDHGAQSAIGAAYYFGKGVPLDRVEGVRWLQLAALNGGQQMDSDNLTAAVNGTWAWEQPKNEVAANQSPLPQYYAATSNPVRAYVDSTPGRDQALSTATQQHTPVRDSLNEPSASSRYLPGLLQPTTPLPGTAAPVIVNRAGPGTYSSANGDIYTQAGPHGVVNAQTGQFSPTN